ncbi:MAG: hypothetical protein WBF07_01920 [Xanthobacteraceae bacterium]
MLSWSRVALEYCAKASAVSLLRRIYDRPKVEDLSNDRCPYEVGRVRVRNLVKDTASDNDIYDASFRESDEAID